MSPLETVRQKLNNSLLSYPKSKFAKEANIAFDTLKGFLDGNRTIRGNRKSVISKIENAMLQKGWLGETPAPVGFIMKPISKRKYRKAKPNVTSIVSRVLTSNLSAEDKITILSKLL